MKYIVLDRKNVNNNFCKTNSLYTIEIVICVNLAGEKMIQWIFLWKPFSFFFSSDCSVHKMFISYNKVQDGSSHTVKLALQILLWCETSPKIHCRSNELQPSFHWFNVIFTAFWRDKFSPLVLKKSIIFLNCAVGRFEMHREPDIKLNVNTVLSL